MSSTYLAKTAADRIQLPPAIAEQIRAAGWSEIKVAASEDNESLTAYPLPHPEAPEAGFATKLDATDGLSISEPLRKQVDLNGQSVMVRIEGEVLRVYLRHVFKTLGFRPN